MRKDKKKNRLKTKVVAVISSVTVAAAIGLPGTVAPTTAYALPSNVPAPEGPIMTRAFYSINYSIPNFFENTNGGSQPELQRAQSLFTIARAYAANGITDTRHTDKMVEWVKLTLNNTNHMPDMHGGIDMRQQQFYLLTLNVIWHTPGLKSRFTASEQNAMLTMAKAAVAATAYVSADYNSAGQLRAANTRTTMDLDANSWPQGNPNWTEAVLGSFMAGAYIMGPQNVIGFLSSYNHANFKTELTNSGLSDVYSTFNMTANATIESYVKNIVNNDNANKPFFRGMKLSTFVSDPFDFYYEAVGKHTFNKIATEGDYVGQLGMGQEFDSIDAFGIRDSLGYVEHGANHMLGNVYLLDFMGDWSSSSQTAKKADLEKRMKVGFSDLLGKLYNGYWTFANGSASYNIYQPDGYFDYGLSLAQGYELTQKVLYNYNFEGGNYNGWTRTNTSAPWATLTTEPTWNGSTTQPDAVFQMQSTTDSSGYVGTYSGNDYIVYSPMKVEAWGTSGNRQIGIIGKYQNNTNYYLMRYNQNTSKLQIVKVKNGAEQVLSEASFSWVLGTIYQVKGVFGSNGTLELYVWGGSVPKVSAVDTEFVSGSMGYYSSRAQSKFDDLLVTER